jgi:hypothetical protein
MPKCTEVSHSGLVVLFQDVMDDILCTGLTLQQAHRHTMLP